MLLEDGLVIKTKFFLCSKFWPLIQLLEIKALLESLKHTPLTGGK